jgi:hypothetical protein
MTSMYDVRILVVFVRTSARIDRSGAATVVLAASALG